MKSPSWLGFGEGVDGLGELFVVVGVVRVVFLGGEVVGVVCQDEGYSSSGIGGRVVGYLDNGRVVGLVGMGYGLRVVVGNHPGDAFLGLFGYQTILGRVSDVFAMENEVEISLLLEALYPSHVLSLRYPLGHGAKGCHGHKGGPRLTIADWQYCTLATGDRDLDEGGLATGL